MRSFIIFLIISVAVCANAGLSTELVYAKVQSYQNDYVVLQTQDKKAWKVSRKDLGKNTKLVSGTSYIFRLPASAMVPLK